MILQRLYQAYDALCDQALKQYVSKTSLNHFTLNHYLYLHAIDELDQPSLSDIASHLEISKPSTTVMINKFMKEGLVDKIPSLQDRRQVYIELTDLGLKVIHLERDAFISNMNQVLDRLTEEEQGLMLQLLEKGLNS